MEANWSDASSARKNGAPVEYWRHRRDPAGARRPDRQDAVPTQCLFLNFQLELRADGVIDADTVTPSTRLSERLRVCEERRQFLDAVDPRRRCTARYVKLLAPFASMPGTHFDKFAGHHRQLAQGASRVASSSRLSSDIRQLPTESSCSLVNGV